MWDQLDKTERQYLIEALISDLCGGSSQWIPPGLCHEPGFDYGVLVVIRQELDRDQRREFGRLLLSRMSPRVADGEAKATGYEPGDYSACLYQLAFNRGGKKGW